MNKSFSQACENNKDPILQVIKTIFLEHTTVWEVGSGTGQHACYFAHNLPHIIWQPTDLEANNRGINCWVEEAGLTNLRKSLTLDVTNKKWPCSTIDALFSANTLHIMPWHQIKCFFAGLATYLAKDALVCFYGPFNYNGQYTSDSNKRFDLWLKEHDPQSGLRDFSDVKQLEKSVNLDIKNNFSMPANNRLLVFQNCDANPVKKQLKTRFLTWRPCHTSSA